MLNAWYMIHTVHSSLYDPTSNMIVVYSTLTVLLLLVTPAHALWSDKKPQEQVDSVRNDQAAHLVKDHNPNPQATFHEEEPKVMDRTQEDAARLVGQHRGPLTKKLAAVSTAGGMVETSVVAWKFANGSIEGTLEQRFLTDSEENKKEILTKARVDCIYMIDPATAVVGGATKDQRAFVVLRDVADAPQLSNLELTQHQYESCESWAREHEMVQQGGHHLQDHVGSISMLLADHVLVCSRRNGDWETCLARQAKLKPHDIMIMEEVVEWME